MVESRFYLLKIRLVDTSPEVWRQFVVPADITLDRLHDVIQIVMGWMDYHLFEFTIGKKRFTEEPESREDGLVAGWHRLGDLVRQKGRVFSYTYDFGDCWKHEIAIVDNRVMGVPLDSPVQCIDGAMACPPEDVGGIPGYMEYCEAMKNPKHPERSNFKHWLKCLPWYGADYDWQKFDIEQINLELAKYLRWSRDRRMPWGISF